MYSLSPNKYSQHKRYGLLHFKLHRLKPAIKVLREQGYIKVNDLRKHWGNAEAFDEYLRQKILLNEEQIAS